jgi:protein-disulfide isomerase
MIIMRSLLVLLIFVTSTNCIANTNYLYQTNQDIVLGNHDAPITIIDYSSFTCPSCANFHNDILPALEEKYIDTGKVKLIFRSYAMRALDLKASAIAICAPKDKFYSFVKVLFKTQNNWSQEATNPITTLENIARLGGMSSEQVKTCFNDKHIEDEIVNIRHIAQNELKVNATPTFIINGKKHTGLLNKDKLFKILDPLLEKK